MKKLYVPERIRLERQYFPGVGKRELRQMIAAGVPGVAATVVCWISLATPGAQLIVLLLGLGYLSLVYGLFARMEDTDSIFTFLERRIAFLKGQKHYFYQQEQDVVYRVQEEHQP